MIGRTLMNKLVIGFVNFLIDYIFPFIRSRKGFKQYDASKFANPKSICSPVVYFIKEFIESLDVFIFKLEWKYNPYDETTDESEWIVRELHPTQDMIYMGTAIGDAMNRLLPNDTIKIYENIVVSPENNVLDGHHRWTASMFINPEQNIRGYQPTFTKPFSLWINLRNYILKYLGLLLYKNGSWAYYPDAGIELNPRGNDIIITDATEEQFLECIYTGKYMDPRVYRYDKYKAGRWIHHVGGQEILLERFKNIQREINEAPMRRRGWMRARMTIKYITG